MRLCVVLLLFAAVGCANSPQDECGGKVLLLWPTAAGEYKFQEIQLSTLKSPYELKGAAAEIYYEGRITEGGFSGPVARPNLTRSSGGVCVPTDVASSLSLGTYAHIERLQQFDQKLDVAQQLSWPRKVGVNIKLFNGDGLSHSNAHYFGRSDAMAVVPYTDSSLPLALNPGILAHEHFHAHFQSQINRVVSDSLSSNLISIEDLFYAGFGVKAAAEMQLSLHTPEGLNKFVLRAWNEGLADFYGAIYSKKSDFFSSSIARLGPYRDLNGPLEKLKTAKSLNDDALSLDPDRNNVVATSYQQGTNLARLMYRIAMSGMMDPEDMLKRVLDRLKNVSTVVTPLFMQRTMDFEEIVPPLLDGLTLNKDACSAAAATLSGEMMQRSFSQCGH